MRVSPWLAAAVAVAGCADTTSAPPPAQPPLYAPAPAGTYAYLPGYPAAQQGAYPQQPQPAPYPPQPPAPPYGQPTPYAPAPTYPAPAPPYYPTPAPTTYAPPAAPYPPAPPQPTVMAPAQSARPMLAPLIGAAAWQAESRAVVQELIGNLTPQDQARVATIPLVFDPHANEINAFAGCDDSGAPFVAATEGLLEAIDAISQTKATDEIYGTQTYDAYVNAVAPRLVSKDGGSALLPFGILPPQAILDPRRASRAHEMFDEIVAFTFGHELSHHYLGHTGCSPGQPAILPGIAQLDQLASAVLPLINQPNETLADVHGCTNLLDTGRARAATAYRWNEEGALWLLDFFARLDRASGANPLLGFLRTHPNPGLRIPVVQGTANTWRLQHPG